MRSLLVTGVVLALAAGGAMAQSPPAQNGPQNSAINKSDSTNRQVTAPVQGHNSFTEGEAKFRIEKQGFTNVGQHPTCGSDSCEKTVIRHKLDAGRRPSQ